MDHAEQQVSSPIGQDMSKKEVSDLEGSQAGIKEGNLEYVDTSHDAVWGDMTDGPNYRSVRISSPLYSTVFSNHIY